MKIKTKLLLGTAIAIIPTMAIASAVSCDWRDLFAKREKEPTPEEQISPVVKPLQQYWYSDKNIIKYQSEDDYRYSTDNYKEFKVLLTNRPNTPLKDIKYYDGKQMQNLLPDFSKQEGVGPLLVLADLVDKTILNNSVKDYKTGLPMPVLWFSRSPDPKFWSSNYQDEIIRKTNDLKRWFEEEKRVVEDQNKWYWKFIEYVGNVDSNPLHKIRKLEDQRRFGNYQIEIIPEATKNTQDLIKAYKFLRDDYNGSQPKYTFWDFNFSTIIGKLKEKISKATNTNTDFQRDANYLQNTYIYNLTNEAEINKIQQEFGFILPKLLPSLFKPDFQVKKMAAPDYRFQNDWKGINDINEIVKNHKEGDSVIPYGNAFQLIRNYGGDLNYGNMNIFDTFTPLMKQAFDGLGTVDKNTGSLTRPDRWISKMWGDHVGPTGRGINDFRRVLAFDSSGMAGLGSEMFYGVNKDKKGYLFSEFTGASNGMSTNMWDPFVAPAYIKLASSFNTAQQLAYIQDYSIFKYHWNLFKLWFAEKFIEATDKYGQASVKLIDNFWRKKRAGSSEASILQEPEIKQQMAEVKRTFAIHKKYWITGNYQSVLRRFTEEYDKENLGAIKYATAKLQRTLYFYVNNYNNFVGAQYFENQSAKKEIERALEVSKNRTDPNSKHYKLEDLKAVADGFAHKQGFILNGKKYGSDFVKEAKLRTILFPNFKRSFTRSFYYILVDKLNQLNGVFYTVVGPADTINSLFFEKINDKPLEKVYGIDNKELADKVLNYFKYELSRSGGKGWTEKQGIKVDTDFIEINNNLKEWLDFVGVAIRFDKEREEN